MISLGIGIKGENINVDDLALRGQCTHVHLIYVSHILECALMFIHSGTQLYLIH
jgi:hypothetical protein